MLSNSRRDFIKKSSLAISFLPFANIDLFNINSESLEDPLSINIFSKHLQFLDWKAAGEIAAELGFSGIDLTVRPNGHVLPETVKIDLPKAIQAIKEGGSSCTMITTAIESVNNSIDVDVLKSAAKENIKFYRSNWFHYTDEHSMEETLMECNKQIIELAKLNQSLGIIGCYQNHAGRNVGGSYWEIKKILENVEPENFGTQYDIRHAMVESGLSWENGIQLLKPYIKTIVLKDFKWGIVNGKWTAINTPIGEGMVDFVKYFKILKKFNLNPPVSMHLEYPLGGAEHGNTNLTVDKKIVFDAMKKDLATIQNLWAIS